MKNKYELEQDSIQPSVDMRSRPPREEKFATHGGRRGKGKDLLTEEEKAKRFILSLRPDFHADLKAEARKNGCSIAQFVRDAIAQRIYGS